jgi:hypothetical protein
MDRQTHCGYMLKLLMSGRGVTAWDMIKGVNCIKAPQRKLNLLQRGYQISVRTITNRGKRYAEYYMTPAQRAHAKKMGGGK